MKPLDRLGTDYIEIMERTVLDFIGHLSKSPKYTDRDYDLFHPSFGGVEGQAPVMLVGQATNGWKFSDLSFDLSLIDSKPLIHRAREWLNTQDPGEYGPLDWVNKDWGKGPFRSFLWQVGYKVVNRYMGNPLDSDEWCNSVVWSNLAKIAPRHGGNPDPLEWDAQLSGTVELFRHEVEVLAPELVVMLTNWDWAEPFLGSWAAPLPFTPDANDRIQWVGCYGKSKIIVTKRPHPFSGDYASDPYVNAILAAWGRS